MFYLQNLPSKIPKAIKSISIKEKPFPNLKSHKEKYSLNKKSVKSRQTLKSTTLINESIYSSSISTAIYRKSSKIKKSEIEVIFVKPEKNKSNLSKRCKHCKSNQIRENISQNTTQTKVLFSRQKKLKHKTSNADLIETITSNKINDTENQTRTHEEDKVNEQQDINHSIELLKQQRNKKIKNFMTKLLIKKKKIKLTKSILPIITETDAVNNEDNKIETNNIITKPVNSIKDSVTEYRQIESKLKKTCNDNNVSNDFHSPVEKYNHSFSVDSLKLKQESFCGDGNGDNSGKLKSNDSHKDSLVKIRLIERKTKNKFTLQQIEYVSSLNEITVSSKINVKGQTKKKIICSNHNIQQIPDEMSKFTKKLSSVRCNNNFEKKFCVPSILIKLDSSELKKSFPNCKCHTEVGKKNQKFLSKNRAMMESDGLPNQIYSRVSNWISSNDFLVNENGKADTDADTVLSNSKNTDFTSVSKIDKSYDRVIVEERTDVIKFDELGGQNTSTENFEELMKNINNVQKKSVRTLLEFSQYSPFENSVNLKSASAPPTKFAVIVEGEESVGSSIFNYSLLNFLMLSYFAIALFFEFCLFFPL